MTTILAAALLVLLVAIPVAFFSPRLAMLATLLANAGITVIGVSAAGNWGGSSVSLGTWLGFGRTTLLVDGLSGVFVALVGVLGLAVTLRYLETRPTRVVCALHASALLALLGVLTADQAFAFLLAWESLTVVLYLLASADRSRPGALVAGYLTGGLNKLSGAALLAAFGLLFGATGSFSFADWHHAALSSPTRDVAFILLVIGFAAKTGIPPLQGALPASYWAAPAPAAATLSIALVGGFYGLWRLVYETLAPATLWWGEALLIVGGVTALIGIIGAIAQTDIRRFLGFSSVEHTGITLLGLGVALIGQATHMRPLVAAGILAATLHLIAHAIGKTLALLAADRITDATGTSEMNPLGGLIRPLPLTSVGLTLATVTLAALPPFGGFVSEWFTLEALLQGFRVDTTLARLLMGLAAASLALTAGLGLLAFAKLYGSTLLGRPRSALGALREPGRGIGMLGLAACALVLGAVAPWEIKWLSSAFQPTLGFDAATTTISHPLVLGPVYPGFSVLAPTWLSIVLPAFALGCAAAVRAVRRTPVRRAAPWVCGTALPADVVQYTPAGYSNPIRVVLRGVYGFSRRVVPVDNGMRPPRYELQTTMVALIEDRVYRPTTRRTLAVTAWARRLQSGRLGAYLAYLLIVVLIALALIPTLRS